MKKLMRLLAAVLALTMLCEMLPLAAFAQSDIGQAVTVAVQNTEEENSTVTNTGSCGENVTWSLDSDGVVTVSGTGEMSNYGWYGDVNPNRVFQDLSGSVRKVVIEDGVKNVGSSVFFRLENLTDVTIPDSVTSIGVDSFNYCTALESITLPETVTFIDTGAFANCHSLKKFKFPSNITCINDWMFHNSTGLTSVVIPASVTRIGIVVFEGCTSLQDIYYEGTEEQWNQIDIGNSNSSLANATIHYNYSGTEEKPSKEFEFKKDNPRFLNNFESFFDFIDKTQHFFHGELVKKQWKWFGHADDVIPEAYYTHISSDAYEQLLSGCSERVRKYVESVRIRYWTGSCYGMAVAAMLNYYAPDRVKLSELDSSAGSIYELTAPANSEKVENFINYYYLMQCLPTLDDFKAERSELYSASVSTAYNEIVAKLQKNVPILAAIYKENGGHAIVLLDIINKDANSCEIRVYDPNEPEEQTMTLYKQLTEWSSIKISYGEYNRMGYHICADELQYLDIRNYFEPNRDSFAFKTDYDEPEIIFDSNVDVSGKYGDSYFDTSKKEYSRNVQIHRILSDTDDYSLMQMFFPQSDENAELELSLTDGNDVNVLLEDTLLTISTDGPVKLTYDESARTVDVKADDPTAVSLLMTQNTVNDSWPWHSWAVDTTGTTTLHAELDSEGLHLTGDGLTNAKYATENADTEQTSEGTINVRPDETGKTSVTIINKNDGNTDDTEVKGEDKAEETTYTVTVNGGTASPAKAKEGETVTITAEKTDTFQNWTVVAGGITLENENLPTTTFTMGKENVVITANYSSGGNIMPPSPGEPGQSPSDDDGAGIVLAIGAAATVAAGIGAIALMPVKVEGKVELADHTALPGAKIALLQNGKVVAQTTTDADGKFALKVKRGSYELTAAYTDANGQLMHKTASFKAPAKNLTVTF